jgi:two-component system sensor histidine kinase QseC
MSIRRYLVLSLFAVLTLVTFVAAIKGYQMSMERSGKQYDQQLRALAQTLAIIDFNSVNTQRVGSPEHFALQIWHQDHLIFSTDNAPNQLMVDQGQTLNEGFAMANFLGQRWRTYTLVDSFKQNVVITAQPLSIRFALAQDIIITAVTPMIIAIMLLSGFIYIIVSQGLKPLTSLKNELSKRSANDFSKLKSRAKHSELTAVLDTLNQLFNRLEGAFEREKHFSSDAAHELKTPLSVLKLNVHNLIGELSTHSQIPASLVPLNNSVERMSHLIDQMLMLNRLNPELFTLEREQIALKPLIQQVISDIYSQINQKKQSIVLESEEVTLLGHRFALQSLLVNLITNASKYTPDMGQIKVSVEHVINPETEQIIIKVHDSGPGIDDVEYDRVFDRFYRIGGDQHNSKVSGCGLGLAIVKHIVDLHSATISLARSQDLGGLAVTIIFNFQGVKPTAVSKNQQDKLNGRAV